MFSWLKINIDKVKAVFSFKWQRSNSPDIKISSKTVDNSKQIHLHQGLTVQETKELVGLLVANEMPKYIEAAKQTAENRVREFLVPIYSNLQTLSPEELNNLTEPDVQMALREASILSGTRTDPELRSILGNLVISRIKDTKGEEFKNILYREAIATVGKLTPGQLKILTIIEVLRYFDYGNTLTWEQYKGQLERDLAPFIDVEVRTADLQHLEYAGCGALGIGTWDFVPQIQQRYTSAFLKIFTPEEIQKLSLPENVATQLFNGTGQFILPVKNAEQLEKVLKQLRFSNEQIKEVVAAYNLHIPSTAEIRERIEKYTDIGVKLFKLWDASELKHMSLTSVGIMVANTYLEEKTGSPVDMSAWYQGKQEKP